MFSGKQGHGNEHCRVGKARLICKHRHHGFKRRLGYGPIGTVTNLAARLCGEAESGQILISRRVLASVKEHVEAESVGELQLKGFAKPVSAFNITGAHIN